MSDEQRRENEIAFPVRTRVTWDDGEGHWPGMVTAHRPNGDVIVKLDTGGAFQVPVIQLRRLPES